MPETNNAVHDAVKKHYGAIAQAADTLTVVNDSCCGDTAAGSDCSCSSNLYNPELLAGLPIDVTGLSLGCGDPVTIADLKPGETVLDLGSGGGIDCFLAVRQVGPSGYVIGVDMTPEMLAKANANKARLGVTNVEFRRGQIELLPVDDGTVDVIMSNCVINLSPDKRAVFTEAYRVLKPGGRVSFSDVVTEGEFSPHMLAQLDQWASCVTGAIDADLYVSLLHDVGFEPVEVVDKVSAEEIIERKEGMPRLFSARIIGYKPV